MRVDGKQERPEILVEWIAALEKALPLLRLLHPRNEEEQRAMFLRGKIAEPSFVYDAISYPFVSLSPVEGPLSDLWYDRIRFLYGKVALIEACGDDERFARVSEEVFPFSAVPVEHAVSLAPDMHALPTDVIVSRFRTMLTECHCDEWMVSTSRISSRLLVEEWEKRIIVQEGLTLSEQELERLLRHELVHIMRFEQGRRQREVLLHVGTARGSLIEEGIACFFESDRVPPPRAVFRHIAVRFARSHSFRETFEELSARISSREDAWYMTLRVKRGLARGQSHGAFTRDALYAQGWQEVKQFAESGGDLAALLSARIHPVELERLRHDGGLSVFPVPQYLHAHP